MRFWYFYFSLIVSAGCRVQSFQCKKNQKSLFVFNLILSQKQSSTINRQNSCVYFVWESISQRFGCCFVSFPFVIEICFQFMCSFSLLLYRSLAKILLKWTKVPHWNFKFEYAVHLSWSINASARTKQTNSNAKQGII